MPRVAYEDKNLRGAALDIIHKANVILADYTEGGYKLTLRQLYYQFVARGLLDNTERNYKRLGGIVSDGRMNGYIDWNAIVDRTRNLADLPHWDSPADLVEAASKQFRSGLWERQSNHVEVWIEKDALVGMIERTCKQYDVPFFSCRGYTSQSEMWSASQRLLGKIMEGKKVTILHLGDHDPSGIDMTRDIEDRLHNFIWQDFLREKCEEEELEKGDREAAKRMLADNYDRFNVRRIALTTEQVERYNPPPNPAKISDSRYRDYALEYGEESWELDALDPPVMTALLEEHIGEEIDWDLWEEDTEEMERGRRNLAMAAQRWDDVSHYLENEEE